MLWEFNAHCLFTSLDMYVPPVMGPTLVPFAFREGREGMSGLGTESLGDAVVVLVSQKRRATQLDFRGFQHECLTALNPQWGL